MEFLYSVYEAFENLKNREIIKLSVIVGIFVSVIWFILAFLFWNDVITFTQFLINLLPFKFIASAGAEFIFLIAWLQMVLVSIGVVFSIFNQFLLNKKNLIIIVLFFAIFWGVLFIGYHSTIIYELQQLIKIFPFNTIQSALSFVLSIFIFYSFFVISVYLGFLLFSENVLIKIIENDYPELSLNSNFSKFKLLNIFIKDFLFFLIGLFIFYPLLFVPVVNLIFIMFLWSYVIKNSIYETITLILGKKEISKTTLWLFALISSIFNFIPLINIFAPAVGVLSIYHYVIEKESI